MPSRGSLALLPRTRKGLVLFWTALFMMTVALQYAAATLPKSALAGQVECESYAIFTSDPTGEVNNQNIYESKADVFLNGGPTSAGGNLTAGSVFYYQVQEPNGTPLMEIRSVTVLGTGEHAGRFFVGLAPFDDTSNNGGEYKVVVSADPELKNGACTKSDNFKVIPAPGSLTITKDISGGPAGGTSGSFDVTVDCGDAGTFEETITVPDPGEVTIDDLPAGAECTVDEDIIQEDPPLGFFWGPPTIVGSPATIVSGQTVTIDVTNNLEPKSGSLKITKVIPDAPEGFEGSFDVHVTCTLGGPFDRTIDFPDPGFVTITDIPSGAVCAVIEIPPTNPPAGFQWAGSLISDPVTIHTGQTAEVTVTNLLIEVLGTPVLTIEKSNDAPGVGEEPLADGDTVTYMLTYTLANGPVSLGIIEDVLPVGVTYVTDSATDSADFVFDGYDAATRTLTWLADPEATASGFVTYEVTIDEGAAEIEQPLTNTACIDSEDTAEDCAESDVFVGEPPLAETAPPNTAPPTDIAGAGDSGAPGGSMLFILLALAAVILAAVFVAPTPASIRKRMR